MRAHSEVHCFRKHSNYLAMARTLLLDFVYYNAVGHTAEALKFAKGFADANPGLEVHFVHGADAPIELVDGCGWIRRAYPVELESTESRARSFAAIPREWDWVVRSGLIEMETSGDGEPGWCETRMLAHLAASRERFRARRGSGLLYPERQLPDGLRYRHNAPIRIRVPPSATPPPAGSPAICVMLGGSAGYSHYPSIRSWIRILRALEAAFPDCGIHLTGVTRPVGGRTHSTYTPANVATIRRSVPRATALYDVPLWEQVALVERCDAFLSPHTGFAFLAPCVGTPWVAISGGDWPEWFFNDVPFYSALPHDPGYPHQGGLEKYRHRGKIPGMDVESLEARIPEIVEALRLVTDPSFTYAAALQRHRANVARANVRQDAIPLDSDF
jgi:hypothetical protein